MTAVEQFIEQLEQQGNSWENASIGRMNISIKIEDYLKLIEQAKEMEKENLYNFYIQGGIDCATQADRTVEDFYNETFKSE
jgi:hypothetical protein